MAYVCEWDKSGDRLYETGLDRGVLYAYDPTVTESTSSGTYQYKDGVEWNGLTAFNVSAEGGDTSKLYADNMKYLSLRATEDFQFTIEAYTYPDEFAQYNGEKQFASSGSTPTALDALIFAQQTRKTFGFSCRTKIGDDTNGTDSGYIIHCCYGCTVNPSDADYQTENDNPDAITFSWEVDTVPVTVEISGVDGLKPTAHVKIKVTKEIIATGTSSGSAYSKIKSLESILYGDDTSSPVKNPAMPLPASIYSLLS